MFPGQVASLEPLLLEFLRAAFCRTSDDPAPLLRGVYFTSGTQEGTPIDRLTGALARSLGVDQARAQTMRPVQGRSYFLERLLKEVIVGEASLVAHSPAALRRRQMLRMAGYAVAALLVLATAAVLLARPKRRSARDRGDDDGARPLRTDGAHSAAGSGQRRRSGATGATARPGARPAARRRRTVMAAGRAVAARQARGLGADRLSPRACNGHCCHG